MEIIVTIEARRSHYSSAEAAERSMTVGELIRFLEEFNEDSKVVFSHDGGYTFGYVHRQDIDEVEMEDE